MKELTGLFQLAQRCLDNRVDEYLQIRDYLRSIEITKFSDHSDILDLVNEFLTLTSESYSLANWSERFVSSLHNLPSTFQYRQVGEHWEVFEHMITGEEEWKATTETESIAISVLKSLNAL